MFLADTMRIFSISAFLLLLSGSIAFADIAVRVDPNGRKVFFNTTQYFEKTELSEGTARQAPLRYSRKAAEFVPLIDEICAKYKVDPDLVKAVIQVESAYRTNALSPAGAIGLMQLMPGTAGRFGVKQIYDPNENIHGGVKYLKFLLDLFDNDLPLAVAAYNAGEGAVQRFKGIPRYKETQNYVRKVLTLYGKNGHSTDYSFIEAKLKVQPPKTIYKYTDNAGVVHFSTQRPTAGAVQEIKLTF